VSSPVRDSARAPRLLLRFALYSALALLLAGGAILWFVQHEETSRVERDAVARAGRVAERTADALTPSDLQRPVSGARLAELDALLANELGDGLVHVRIWTADGRVLYSDEHTLIGTVAKKPAELERALRGGTMHEVVQLGEEGFAGEDLKTLETLVPLRIGGAERAAGAMELYYEYAPIAANVSSAVTPIGVALALTWILLYAALFPILRQVTKALEQRNRSLARQAEAYRRTLEEREQAERRLSEAERNYRNFVEQLPLVTYIDRLDDTSSSIYMSPQIEKLLGYPVAAWLADPEFLPKVLHPQDRERVLALHRESYAAGRSFSAEYRLVAHDGHVVWVRDEVMIARDRQGRPRHAQGFLLDVTKRKQAEEQLERRHAEVTALHDVALELIDELDADRVLELIIRRAGRLVGAEDCYVYLHDPGSDELVVRLGTGVFADYLGYRLRKGDGLAGRVWESGEPRAVDDYHSWTGRQPDLARLPFHAVAGVPLLSRREIVGVLGVAFAEEGRTFGEGEIALLSRFAHLASLALESARLYEAASTSEEKFRTLVSNVPGAIFRCAFDADWTMEFLSDAIEEIAGYPASDFIHNAVRTYASIVHPDDAQMLEDAVGDGAPYSVEYRVLHADGGVRWVLERGQGVEDAAGNPWLDGVIFDVTEQNATAEDRSRLAAIVESSDDAIMSASPDGCFASWNSGAERIFGYTAEEVLGRPISILTPPEREGEALELLANVVRGGTLAEHETVRVRKDGTRIDVAFTFSPLRSATGEIVGVSAIAHDISARKLAEAERERLLAEAERARGELAGQNERLLELDRLKDEFIALVSHELRTPLTSIRGYVELLRDGEAGELNEEQLQFLGVVERNSHRLLHLVGDLLFLAQVEAGKLSLELGAVDLSAIASESVEAARPAADEKEVTLTLATGPTPLLAGDRARLAQLLDNLVSNALKFTPRGGRVDVRLRASKGNAIVEVRDSGIGIPAGEQRQLFQRFFRSSNATAQAIQGTGLGLAISKAIVDAHGGRIAVTSQENDGTTFRVTFPIPRQLAEPDQAVAL
jgi:PAS domain S-box-containing protein